MKHILTALAAFSISLSQAMAIDSRVKAVTIFLNQAEVTRQATVTVSPGKSELRFGGISTLIDPASVQVKATGELLIMGTTFQLNYLLEEVVPKELKPLKDSIRTAERDIAAINHEVKVLRDEEEMLKANRAIGGKNETLTVAELKAMTDYYRTRLLAINTRQYELLGDLQQKQQLLDKLTAQFDERNTERRKVAGEIVVEIQASKAGSASFELTYVVSGTNWVPEYDVRSAGLNEPLSLSYKAVINQNTGEHWKDVMLSLSTGNPSAGGYLPAINPWYLSFQRPMYKSMSAGSAVGAVSRSASADAVYEVADEEMAFSMADYTETVQQSTAMLYELQIPYTLLSGAKPTTVSIREDKLVAEYIYQATPKLSQDAFLVAKASNWNTLDLLPGSMNVFFEGGFVTKTYLDPNTTEKTLNISLGVDNSLSISRKAVQDLTKTQSIGTSRKMLYVFDLTVNNKKGQAVKLEMIDQVPLSRDKDIEVTVVNLSGGVMTSVEGKVVWLLEVPARQTKTVQLAYDVKHPKDRVVQGL